MTVALADIARAVHTQSEALSAFTKAQNEKMDALATERDELRSRLEELEARASSPGRVSRPIEAEAGYKSFHTPSGIAYELPASAKIADVEALAPSKKTDVSLDRWLGALVAGEKSADSKAVEFVREQKQLVTTTTGVLIPDQYQSEWIDLIRAQQVLNRAGMTTVVLSAKSQLSSAVESDPAATWHTEAGSISVDNPTFSEKTLTAETLVCRCTASLEVTQDSPDFGRQLMQVMSRAMAVELDRVGLAGDGTPPEPRGILNTIGVNQTTGIGGITNYSPLLTGVRSLLENNIPLEVASRNVVMSPGVWFEFESETTGIASDKTQLARPASLANTNFLVTTNGLDTEDSPQTSSVVMGDFSDLVLGVRREASVEVLKLTSYATNLVLEFVGYLRAGYLVRRPKSFWVGRGISIV